MARRKQSTKANREPRWRCFGTDDVRAICASASLDLEPERIERFMYQINPQIFVLNKLCSISKQRMPYRRVAILQEVRRKIEDLWSSIWKITDHKDLHVADAWIKHHVAAGDIKFGGLVGRGTGFYDPRDEFPDLGDAHTFPKPSGDPVLASSRLKTGVAEQLAAFHLACRFMEMRAQKRLRSAGNPKRIDFWRYQLVTLGGVLRTSTRIASNVDPRRGLVPLLSGGSPQVRAQEPER
jgi:hypothetical protein